MEFPKLSEHPEVKDAVDRLRELKREEGQLEATLAAYRGAGAERASLEERATKYAAGIELPEPETEHSHEQRIERTKARLEVVTAAVAVQTRKLAELRERVGVELSESLREQYRPLVEEITRCVKALSAAIRKHHDFASAMREAGLPWIGRVPLGGNYRQPGLLVDFGDESIEFCYATDFIRIAREFGYLERKETKRAAAN